MLLAAALASACTDDDPLIVPGGNAGTGGSGGSGPTSFPGPALRGDVTLGDTELAREALTLLGSSAVTSEGHCRNCHTLGRPTLTNWARLTNAFTDDCLGDSELGDTEAVDAMFECFREHAEPSATLSPSNFGIYAAATHLPWFSFVFEHATELADDAEAEQADFVTRVGMPRAGTPLTQAEFDVVAEWFARGLPALFDLVPEDSGEDCVPALSPRLQSHVDEMASSGWRARNAEVPLLMFGCDGGQAGLDCLSAFPLAREQAYGENWDAASDAQIRILSDNTATRTTFWSRASADGRFIASGMLDPEVTGSRGQFLDLQTSERIPVNFSYDPTFFPDNSGFLVQQGGGNSSAAPGGGPTNGSADRGDVAVVCDQSVLGGAPAEVTGEEAQCIQLESQVGLYQQLAKSLDGEDYWVIFGSYDSDNGGFRPVLANPSAAFESQTQTTLIPMVNQGARFEAAAPTRVSTPLQGDPMLSPSGRLMVTRVKGREYTRDVNGTTVVAAEQSGYALHLVTTSRNGNNWSASLEDVGRICMQGGKAVVSYDERWMVFHHYIVDDDATALGFSGPDDPDFQVYREFGSSNLYLVDLLDGSQRVITNMDPGQYALFPHFRSDGWIYFVVRTLDGDEYFAASDAALLLEGSSD